MSVENLKIDVQGMRDKILDLAMRGKLVSQGENDEPASVLLEKITQEKEQLIKEKKIKKTKLLPKITDEEKPFAIPDSWEWVRLGELLEILRGGSPRPIKNYLTTDKEGINWIKIGDTSPKSKYILSAKEKIIPEGLKKSRKVNIGDFLLSNSMSFGRPYILKINGAVHDGWLILKNNYAAFEKNYLYYGIVSKVVNVQFNKKATGSTVKNLNKERVADTMIPLPPLNEQKRIAAKVEELFSLLDIIEESTNNYEKLQKELKEKILTLGMQGKLVGQDPDDEPADKLYAKIQAEKEQLIKEKKIKKTKPLPKITDEEKPFELPASWKWVRIGSIANWSAGATPLRKKKEYYVNGTIPWLKTGDLNDGIVNKTSEFITELGVKNSSVKLNKPGNVLIAMYGATIGKLGIVGKNSLTTNQACLGGELYSGMYNWYLFYYLLSSRRALIKLGAGGAQPNISKQKVENYLLSLPPLNEQKRIATKIESLFSLIDSQA